MRTIKNFLFTIFLFDLIIISWIFMKVLGKNSILRKAI